MKKYTLFIVGGIVILAYLFFRRSKSGVQTYTQPIVTSNGSASRQPEQTGDAKARTDDLLSYSNKANSILGQIGSLATGLGNLAKGIYGLAGGGSGSRASAGTSIPLGGRGADKSKAPESYFTSLTDPGGELMRGGDIGVRVRNPSPSSDYDPGGELNYTPVYDPGGRQEWDTSYVNPGGSYDNSWTVPDLNPIFGSGVNGYIPNQPNSFNFTPVGGGDDWDPNNQYQLYPNNIPTLPENLGPTFEDYNPYIA